MRERFGDWGAGLSEADFACALAAGGLLRRWAEPSWTPERLAAELQEHLYGRAPVWLFSELMLQFDARALAQAWRLFRESLDEQIVPIIIDVSSLDRQRIDPEWLTGQLTREEVGAASVNIGLGFRGRGERPRATPGYPMPTGDPGDIVPPPEDPPNLEEVLEAAPRFLQAQLEDPSDPEHPRQVHRLRRGGSYRVNVRIGLPDAAWMAVEEPFPVPPEPPEPEGHRLTVVFWEPRVSPEPQVETLWLPPKGNSRAASFSFQLSADVGAIAARITVLHHNRVLQTGLLRASSLRVHGFRLDAAPRTRLEGLSARSRFDVALVLNHDGEGTARLTAAADDRAAVISLDDGPLAELTRFLKNKISEIADEPQRYAALSSPGTVELLRTLAQKGGALHEHLCLHTDLAVLAEAKRIHLTSAKAGSFFPVELLYRFEPPDDTAGLCPNAAVALKEGECPGGCPADKRQHVCPLGFWGLSRVVERHAHQREDQRIDGDFLLRPEPIRERAFLPLSGRSLLAASGKASEVKQDAVEALVRALGERGRVQLVTTWEDWAAHASSPSDPTLLVLLPHHEQLAGEEILEIGAASRLKSDLVRTEHVRRQDGPYPILLLLGCETNLARIAFDNFVTRFRDKGAAVVVSTIATILGRHASPAAARLVELLDEEAREGGSTFGEVMVRLRRKLLETESPMALGLTAYGDADWILVRHG